MNAAPAVGTLVVDSARDQLGEFRGEQHGQWSLRPMGGGKEWPANPDDVHPMTAEQRLRAGIARANARSRGEVL